MELRFEGDINVYLGIVIAISAAVAIFWLYRRETRHRAERLAFLLPLLRGVAVAMIVLMLTGPVLRGSVSVADLSRVLVFVDGSKSMSLTDASMSPERKLLNARRLGWLDDESIDTSLYDCAQLLASIREPIEGASAAETRQSYDRFVHAAVDALPNDEPFRELLEQELVDPMDRINEQSVASQWSDQQLAAELEKILATAQSWRLRFESEYRQRSSESSPSDAQNNAVSHRLDELTRWKRVEAALLSDANALLPRLDGDHHVDLLSISGNATDGESVRLWQPLENEEYPESFDPIEPVGAKTDLVTQIDSVVGELPTTQRLAVVLFTDGQHNQKSIGNSGISPLHMARLLGRRGVPIYPVGVGAAQPPADLAVLAVQIPESVFADDRVKGDILVKDNMPAGQPMRIKIEVEGQTVWSDQLTTDGSATRTVEFDFAIKELVENRIAGSLRDVESISLPLALNVSIEPVEGEIRDDNNSHETSVRAITRPRRALLIDGRPRWEFRYLRNMLDRDEHWDVNHVLASSESGRSLLPRGNRSGQFPDDLTQLLSYDIIVLGEVPGSVFRRQEFDWIKQFVAIHGGGLMLIDGQREKLRSYVDSPLRALIPIRWTASNQRGLRHVSLSLTDRGRATSAFALSGDSDESAVQWNQLPPLRWLAPVEALPGSETLVTGSDGVETSPALVMRRYGAGTVLYSAFDDSWRWRFEVADQFHQRYWNQVATFIMESPYAIHDRFASIDTGGFTYRPGESANLKVRLRDAQGQPLVDADADAILYRDNAIVAIVPLEGGAASGGVLRGTTKPLEPGTYQVGVQAAGFDDQQLTVRAEFVVLGNASGEMNVLFCNEELLRQMAQLSGGQYLREEDVGRLTDLLAPQADGTEEVAEIALWRSWYWFIPLLGLFTAEWFVRKRMGLM